MMPTERRVKMQKKNKYKKPEITRIKLEAGEAVMANCKQATQKLNLVKNSAFPCENAPAGCRNPVS